MIILTPEEIKLYSDRLADYPQALAVLKEVEDCEGDVEDAAISLALRAGQEPDTNEQWLAGFSKRYRHIACQPRFRQLLMEQQPAKLMNHLMEQTDCPDLLALPVVFYILKSGVVSFCHSFDNSRV